MNIVDSSLWVEYFLENDIDQSVIDTIKDTDNLYIPVISLYAELYTQDKHFENLDHVHYFSK